MGLFSKKKQELIPEVGAPPHLRPIQSGRPQSPAPSQAPSYRSTAPSYVPPSQGGSGYANASHYSRPQDQYTRQPTAGQGQGQSQGGAGGGGDRYGKQIRGDAYGGKAARDELLAGAPPPPQQRTQGGYNGSYGDPAYGEQQSQQYNDEDEEVEGIKQQMRFVKQESLASTRNAVRIAREAEETARATLDKLGDQSGQLQCG